jgi:antitoxin component of MazEF toxin-antitoxin module
VLYSSYPPVVMWETGELVLPRETLEESHTIAGTELVVMARAGQILLLVRVQVRRRLEDIRQKMRGNTAKVTLCL